MKDFTGTYFGWWHIGIIGKIDANQKYPGEMIVAEDFTITLRILGHSLDLDRWNKKDYILMCPQILGR
jgi:hypothetical protein